MASIPELLATAAAWCRSGQFGLAGQVYRQVLELDPGHAEALGQLGQLAYHDGRPDLAVEYLRRAAAAQPADADRRNNLGVALLGLGQAAEAEAALREALRLRPGSADAHNNLGNALSDQGRLAEAEASYREALRLRPDYPEAHNNLGMALRELGRAAEAEVAYREALRLQPDFAAALNNLGGVLHRQGRLAEAEAEYRAAIRLRPAYAEAHTNLGSALHGQGRLAEAEAAHREALRLWPDFAAAHNNLGEALHGQGRLAEAEAAYGEALRLRPRYHEARANLGNALYGQGRIDEALTHYRRALEHQPDYAVAHSAMLLALHYQPGVTPEGLLSEHAEYQARHAAPLRASWRPHGNDRDPDRPLRLGLVSPDFGRHPVGYFLLRAAEALAHRPVSTAYYSSRSKADELTARFRAAAGLWRDVAELSDEQLAEQVRADGIDVLIDLAGHTSANRLLAFARRPAPVQCTWLGYVGTTGLEAIDYLIADEHLVPPWAEKHHGERVLRLPGGHAGYDPPAYAPDPGPPPALSSGRVTFGCFNNPAKLSAPALAAFADVLRRAPGSRLILKYRGVDDPAVAARLQPLFAAAGVDPARVELRGATAHADHLGAYREVDVALDPFPYAGVMTTIDALWMGVPVVTLPGQTFASRHGQGLLSVVGLANELAARDADDYTERATALAGDLGRLSELRAGLRQWVARSPLCDGERLADELLAAVRTAWRSWAAGH